MTMDDITEEEEVHRMDAVKPDNIDEGENYAMTMSRKEKRKAMKKEKRKQLRKETAVKEREEQEARANDPEERMKEKLREQEEAEIAERERKEFEERERLWLEAAAAAARRKADEEENRKKLLAETLLLREEGENEGDDGDHEWEYVEDGPAEIIWKDNEIIFKKKRIRVPKRTADCLPEKQDDNRPTSNPLPPQSSAFAPSISSFSAQELLESVAQQTPNFGTEQDKAHCPFHLKTGVCRFGNRCNRTHFYPDKSCTLLIKNMYSGPGLAWEQDEGLEHTDEEIEHCFEEFYEDVHTEFLKFGEIVNFKVCRNGSFHLRGNVYVHYKSLESAFLAYNSMSGRYFAGKQIICEFVGVTRWKIAICGEYMKSRLKNCSRGTACNFIHCFRNPGGDYEWADWDNLPPKHWVKKMVSLFGYSHDLETADHIGSENWEIQKRVRTNERVSSGAFNAISEKDEFADHGDHRSISIEKDNVSRKQSSSCREKEHFGREGYTSIYHSDKRSNPQRTCHIRNGSVHGEVDHYQKEKKVADNHHEGRKHKRDGSCHQTRKERERRKSRSSCYHERNYRHDSSDYDSHPPENILPQTATDDDTINASNCRFAVCKTEKLASFKSRSRDQSNECIKNNLQKHVSYNSDDQDMDRIYQKHMDIDESIYPKESIDYENRNKSKKTTLSSSQSGYNSCRSGMEESAISSQKSTESDRVLRRKSKEDDTKKEHRRKKKQRNGEREDGHEDSASPDLGRSTSRKRSSRQTSIERV